jgi:hypothetical protein
MQMRGERKYVRLCTLCQVYRYHEILATECVIPADDFEGQGLRGIRDQAKHASIKMGLLID